MNKETLLALTNASDNRQAYTFSDITLQDIPSDIIPAQANTECQVTTNYRLKKPIISAAMDTVTEAEMAVAMAKNGGLGVIHRNLSIEEQVRQVEWVRRQVHFGGMITDPVTFRDTDTVADLQREKAEHGWSFTSFPIVDAESRLVGMITKDDLEFVGNDNPQLAQIMNTEAGGLLVGDDTMDVDAAFDLMLDRKVKKLPIIDSERRLVGMYVWADVRMNKATRSQFSLDRDGRLLVAAAVGPGSAERERIDRLVVVGCPILVIDCSHGACKAVVEQIKYIRETAPTVDIIAGNIASYVSAMYLLQNAPPDALKLGVGPGSICTTRQVTGHGVPQITAIFEVWRAVQDSNDSPTPPIIADGGITCSGDIVKALAVGADCVMLGGLLAGTEESPGEIITHNQKKYKRYRGMGARSAMAERSGSRTRYFKGNTTSETLTTQQQEKITPEGIEGIVEYKGGVASILQELCGGIQSGMAHSNARTTEKLRENAQLWIQSTAGYIEGKPHDVIEHK